MTSTASGAWIDVSVPLDEAGPQWPGSFGRRVRKVRSLDGGDSSTDSVLELDIHCGTHVDAPAHVLHGAPGVEVFDPMQLCGRAVVLDATGQSEVAADLLHAVPANVDGVLFRTDNSERGLMRAAGFEPNFVGISTELAVGLARLSKIRFVGNDYLSIQPFGGNPLVHTALLERGIAVIEGVDLTDVTPGVYDMVGLMLPLGKTEAAPTRILLRALQ